MAPSAAHRVFSSSVLWRSGQSPRRRSQRRRGGGGTPVTDMPLDTWRQLLTDVDAELTTVDEMPRHRIPLGIVHLARSGDH